MIGKLNLIELKILLNDWSLHNNIIGTITIRKFHLDEL